jgi:hypothetical protein
MRSKEMRGIRHMDRRSFITAVIGAFAAFSRTGARTVSAIDHCYWETRQSVCADGRRREYRCQVCCAGGST